MSKATTENSPDEIRTCPLCGGCVFWFPVSNYWGCERCKNTFNRYTVFPDEVKKTSVSAVGNMAAMREALTESRNLLHRLANLTSAGKEHWAMAKVRAEEIVNITSEKIPAMIMQISAALAAPLRNCDVGTAEEQAKRLNEWCNGRHCINCRFKGGWPDECKLKWAQMPYEEGGAK